MLFLSWCLSSSKAVYTYKQYSHNTPKITLWINMQEPRTVHFKIESNDIITNPHYLSAVKLIHGPFGFCWGSTQVPASSLSAGEGLQSFSKNSLTSFHLACISHPAGWSSVSPYELSHTTKSSSSWSTYTTTTIHIRSMNFLINFLLLTHSIIMPMLFYNGLTNFLRATCTPDHSWFW